MSNDLSPRLRALVLAKLPADWQHARLHVERLVNADAIRVVAHIGPPWAGASRVVVVSGLEELQHVGGG